jgi:hemolysin activation/secretion protein
MFYIDKVRLISVKIISNFRQNCSHPDANQAKDLIWFIPFAGGRQEEKPTILPLNGMRRFPLFCMLATCAVALASPSIAQNSGDSGQIERRIEQTRPDIQPADPDIRMLPEGPVQPVAPDTERFVLAAVVIEGATIFDTVAFAPYYKDLLAREITLVDVEKILARITKKYRDAGYILSRAVARPQNLATGVVRIDVIEGYVDEIIYEGEDVPKDMLQSYTRRISADRPLRLKTLERYILLINDINGIKVDPRLRAIDEEQGRYALVLKTSHKPVDGLAFLNNRGTPAVGRLQGWASAGVNGVLGWRERFQLGFFTITTQPQELLYFEGLYAQAVGADGLNYSVLVSQSEIDAGSEQNILGI